MSAFTKADLEVVEKIKAKLLKVFPGVSIMGGRYDYGCIVLLDGIDNLEKLLNVIIPVEIEGIDHTAI